MTKKPKQEKIKNNKITQEEYEKKVIEMGREGFTSEKIGEKLKKSGIHPKEYSKKISDILKKEKIYINPDLKNTQKKLENIEKHYAKNKQDKRAKREKDRIFSKVRKIKKYLKLD